MTTLLVCYAGGGILLAFLALPLLAEKVPPNRLYGFRVRATLENRALWYAVNRFGARRLIFSGAATTLASLVLFPFLSLNSYSLACLGVLLITVTITVVQSFRYLGRLTRGGPGREPRA